MTYGVIEKSITKTQRTTIEGFRSPEGNDDEEYLVTRYAKFDPPIIIIILSYGGNQS